MANQLIKNLRKNNIILQCNKLNSRKLHSLKKSNNIIYKKILNATKFLNNTVSLAERIYCIEHNITDNVRCYCNNIVIFSNRTIGYRKYCSVYCVSNNKEVCRKKKHAWKDKTQEDINEIVNKRKKTNLKKYGNECVLQSTYGQSKIKKTKLNRYGNENYNNIEKHKQTNLKRYGDENWNNREKYKKTWKDKSQEEINEHVRKNKETKLKRYGDENWNNRDKSKQTNLRTCLEKYNRNSPSQQHISKDSLNKLNDKQWLIEQHYTNCRTHKCIAEELNVSSTTVDRYYLYYGLEAKNYNTGAYNKTLFQNDPKLSNKPAHLYIIKCYNETESFIKIGITINSIESRFISFEYHYDILLDLELPLYVAFNIEQDILNKFNEYSFQPAVEFGGQYECLNESCYNDIIEYLQ